MPGFRWSRLTSNAPCNARMPRPTQGYGPAFKTCPPKWPRRKRGLAALASGKAAESDALANDAAEKAAVAKDRLDRLAKGEDVTGGLGKPVDFEKVLMDAGLSRDDINFSVELHRLCGFVAIGRTCLTPSSSRVASFATKTGGKCCAKSAPCAADTLGAKPFGRGLPRPVQVVSLGAPPQSLAALPALCLGRSKPRTRTSPSPKSRCDAGMRVEKRGQCAFDAQKRKRIIDARGLGRPAESGSHHPLPAHSSGASRVHANEWQRAGREGGKRQSHP
jgi:hypothetical protein